jgi:hypothetical protein
MKISPMPASGMPNLNQQGNLIPTGQDNNLRMKTNHNSMQDIQTQQPQETTQKAASAVTQPLSPQLALLAKQRRALQRDREALNRERARLSQSQTPMIDVARLKSEPLQVLLDNGVTYDQLTQAILSNQESPDINALKSELKALKEGIDKRFVDNEAQAEKQVLMQMRMDAQKLVENSSEYELVKETHSVPLVMQLIERTYRASGEVLDVPDALKLVEDELFKDAQKIAKLKKMQSVLSPIPAQHIPSMQSQLRTSGMRTLTNRDTASVPMSPRARALAAFYGQLKR